MFKISDTLEPYKNLYENCLAFIINHKKWMNAQIGTYDPEQIDQDVTIYYRNITKLKNTFMTIPNPLKLAKTVI